MQKKCDKFNWVTVKENLRWWRNLHIQWDHLYGQNICAECFVIVCNAITNHCKISFVHDFYWWLTWFVYFWLSKLTKKVVFVVFSSCRGFVAVMNCQSERKRMSVFKWKRCVRTPNVFNYTCMFDRRHTHSFDQALHVYRYRRLAIFPNSVSYMVLCIFIYDSAMNKFRSAVRMTSFRNVVYKTNACLQFNLFKMQSRFRFPLYT